MLRLTELPESIKKLLDDGKLEMGHARCLLTLDEAIAVPLARQAVTLGWSVRELEDAARRAQTAPKGKAKRRRRAIRTSPIWNANWPNASPPGSSWPPGKGGRGKLVIHYHSNDELEGILRKMR